LHNALKSRMVEDALRVVGQAHTQLGAPDPRKEHHGGINFWIQRHIKTDDPPCRVKPVPIIIIV
jgi:hypothetical protein